MWHHVPTDAGWEIRDEQSVLVAIVPDAQHRYERDAIALARGALVDEFIGSVEKRVADLRTRQARLIQTVGAIDLAAVTPALVESRLRELADVRALITAFDEELRDLHLAAVAR